MENSMLGERMRGLLEEQLQEWELARRNFGALAAVECRVMEVDGAEVTVQHNPARIASTGAKVDKAAVAARPCFLCGSNRPEQQRALRVDAGKLAPLGKSSADAGSDGEPGVGSAEYEVLVNPFPIFPVHFTVPAVEHTPQLISADGCRRFRHILRLAMQMPGMALFYNGPKCGASAPDHFHFQVVERSALPIFGWDKVPFRIESALFSDEDEAVEWFGRLCDSLATLPENEGEDEPRMNLLCAREDVAEGDAPRVRVIVIPRRAHRPDFYGTGEGRVLLSPASVDLGGVVVSPVPEDFHEKITPAVLHDLFAQTCY